MALVAGNEGHVAVVAEGGASFEGVDDGLDDALLNTAKHCETPSGKGRGWRKMAPYSASVSVVSNDACHSIRDTHKSHLENRLEADGAAAYTRRAILEN